MLCGYTCEIVDNKCVFEVVGGSTSWMSVLSWWGRVFEVCVSGW